MANPALITHNLRCSHPVPTPKFYFEFHLNHPHATNGSEIGRNDHSLSTRFVSLIDFHAKKTLFLANLHRFYRIWFVFYWCGL